MNTTNPNRAAPPRSSSVSTRPANPNLRLFRPPPLRAMTTMDVAKEIDALHRRRIQLSQRIGTVWIWNS